MQRRKRILTIIVIMAGACVMAAGVAMLELYRAAIREERARLESVAGSQARLVETMVRAATGGQVSLNTVVNRLREAHKNSNGYGRTGEFTLGCREGRNISYLFRHGRKGSAAPSEVPVDSDFAEPMRRAVEGLSGTMRGRDYAGHEVLAAYEPVRGTDLGIVEKVDMAEIRGPFIRAAATAASVTAFVIAIGAFLIYRITRPVIAALESLTRDLEAKVEERTRELREAQGALLRREKPAMLGQLAGSVAHELRNPLAVISNAAYYLKTVLPPGKAKVEEHLRIISAKVNEADKIILDLLDFGGRREPKRGRASVRAMLKQAVEAASVPDRIAIEKRIPSDLPSVLVDERQIEQVFLNLITNACQAMRKGGTLAVTAEAAGGEVRVAFSDSGCGIPSGNMEKIFEPLFTTEGQGIGLGLSVSRLLVDLNGGAIEVESREGGGSTFTVTLPTEKGEA